MAAIRQQSLPLSSPSRLANGLATARPAGATASPSASGAAAARQVSGQVGGHVRWGAAVVQTQTRSQDRSWREVSSRTRRGRRTTVWVDEVLPPVANQAIATGGATRLAGAATRVATATAAPQAGDSFARNRIRHAFELFGACMMIITFLALAMFA